MAFVFVLVTCIGHPSHIQLANAHGDTLDPAETVARVTYSANPMNATDNTPRLSQTHLTAFAIRTFDSGDCAPAQALIDSGIALQVPVLGEMSQPFGRTHAGVDWQGVRGDRIRAAHDGEVIFAGWSNEGYGYLITVLHKPLDVASSPMSTIVMKTHYAHLSRLNVRVGTHVEAGQIIGEMGSTGNADGPHLHFEVRLDSVAVNPMCFFEPANIKQANTHHTD